MKVRNHFLSSLRRPETQRRNHVCILQTLNLIVDYIKSIIKIRINLLPVDIPEKNHLKRQGSLTN